MLQKCRDLIQRANLVKLMAKLYRDDLSTFCSSGSIASFPDLSGSGVKRNSTNGNDFPNLATGLLIFGQSLVVRVRTEVAQHLCSAGA